MDGVAAEQHKRRLCYAIALVVALAIVLIIWSLITGALSSLPTQATIFMVAWLVLSLGAILMLPRWSFAAAYLISFQGMLSAWCISTKHNIVVIEWPFLVVFIVYLAALFSVAWRSLRHRDPSLTLDRVSWQNTLIRLYVGYDLIPHYTEKLFAGPATRHEDVVTFANLGLPAPEFFVILAGLCEVGVTVGLALGVFTRLAAGCSALYILICGILGGHFLVGFIWADVGGGWEYPALLVFLMATFAINGAGAFSIDHALLQKYDVPGWLRILMVPRTKDAKHARLAA